MPAGTTQSPDATASLYGYQASDLESDGGEPREIVGRNVIRAIADSILEALVDQVISTHENVEPLSKEAERYRKGLEDEKHKIASEFGYTLRFSLTDENRTMRRVRILSAQIDGAARICGLDRSEFLNSNPKFKSLWRTVCLSKEKKPKRQFTLIFPSTKNKKIKISNYDIRRGLKKPYKPSINYKSKRRIVQYEKTDVQKAELELQNLFRHLAEESIEPTYELAEVPMYAIRPADRIRPVPNDPILIQNQNRLNSMYFMPTGKRIIYTALLFAAFLAAGVFYTPAAIACALLGSAAGAYAILNLLTPKTMRHSMRFVGLVLTLTVLTMAAVLVLPVLPAFAAFVATIPTVGVFLSSMITAFASSVTALVNLLPFLAATGAFVTKTVALLITLTAPLVSTAITSTVYALSIALGWIGVSLTAAQSSALVGGIYATLSAITAGLLSRHLVTRFGYGHDLQTAWDPSVYQTNKETVRTIIEDQFGTLQRAFQILDGLPKMTAGLDYGFFKRTGVKFVNYFVRRVVALVLLTPVWVWSFFVTLSPQGVDQSIFKRLTIAPLFQTLIPTNGIIKIARLTNGLWNRFCEMGAKREDFLRDKFGEKIVDTDKANSMGTDIYKMKKSTSSAWRNFFKVPVSFIIVAALQPVLALHEWGRNTIVAPFTPEWKGGRHPDPVGRDFPGDVIATNGSNSGAGSSVASPADSVADIAVDAPGDLFLQVEEKIRELEALKASFERRGDRINSDMEPYIYLSDALDAKERGILGAAAAAHKKVVSDIDKLDNARIQPQDYIRKASEIINSADAVIKAYANELAKLEGMSAKSDLVLKARDNREHKLYQKKVLKEGELNTAFLAVEAAEIQLENKRSAEAALLRERKVLVDSCLVDVLAVTDASDARESKEREIAKAESAVPSADPKKVAAAREEAAKLEALAKSADDELVAHRAVISTLEAKFDGFTDNLERTRASVEDALADITETLSAKSDAELALSEAQESGTTNLGKLTQARDEASAAYNDASAFKNGLDSDISNSTREQKDATNAIASRNAKTSGLEDATKAADAEYLAAQANLERLLDSDGTKKAKAEAEVLVLGEFLIELQSAEKTCTDSLAKINADLATFDDTKGKRLTGLTAEIEAIESRLPGLSEAKVKAERKFTAATEKHAEARIEEMAAREALAAATKSLPSSSMTPPLVDLDLGGSTDADEHRELPAFHKPVFPILIGRNEPLTPRGAAAFDTARAEVAEREGYEYTSPGLSS